ncbi:MAG: SAM-dependent chlorinase/fluorinase [Bryobacteraceae bacterium]
MTHPNVTPNVTLTTDFGLEDHFVAVMKGVILSICAKAQITDISHSVRPFEIAQGAFLLAQAWHYFPEGTIHVAVVDPGVGSARRPILVEAEGHFFVGPDNGVLALVYSPISHQARLVSNDAYFLKPVSTTFHGRDIFAPTAAHLAAGVPANEFGRIIEDHLKPVWDTPQRTSKRSWTGAVLHVDRFGNLITNFLQKEFPELKQKPFEFSIGTRRLSEVATSYAEMDSGAPFLIVGSSGYIEIAANRSRPPNFWVAAGPPCELQLR